MAGYLKTTEERFWALIEQRRRAGDADTARLAELDERIWDLYGSESAVMFTDLAGFSRRVEAFGILEFLELIVEQREHLLPIAAAHDGVLIKAEADSMLLLFRRPSRALACARAMQARCVELNDGRPPEKELLLCVGLGHGKILRLGDHDVFGAEINAASKLGEDVAKAQQILVTAAFAAAIGGAAELEPLEDERVPGALRVIG